MDLNPVIVKKMGYVVVDAKVILGGQPDESVHSGL
jgi:hypothetical protein